MGTDPGLTLGQRLPGGDQDRPDQDPLGAIVTADVARDARLPPIHPLQTLHVQDASFEAASRLCAVAESTVSTKSSFARFGSLEMIHGFVFDNSLSTADANALRARRIEMLVA